MKIDQFVCICDVMVEYCDVMVEYCDVMVETVMHAAELEYSKRHVILQDNLVVII